MIASIISLVGSALDKIFPNKSDAQKAKLKLLELEQQGELTALETQAAMITAEANSEDKWTSRARPSFLYVMYAVILLGVPLAILNIYFPDQVRLFESAFKDYLNSVPKILWECFTTGYLGYVGARSYDKTHGKNK